MYTEKTQFYIGNLNNISITVIDFKYKKLRTQYQLIIVYNRNKVYL